MQANLKDWHRLETAVHLAATQLAERARVQNVLTLSAYDESLNEKHKERYAEVTDLLIDAQQLMQLRYRIRQLIKQANNEVGIDDLLNRSAGLQAVIRLVAPFTERGILHQRQVFDDALLARVQAKFASVREHAGSAVAQDDEVTIPVLKETDFDQMHNNSKRWVRDIEKIKDEVGSLNIHTKRSLVLNDRETELLRQHVPYGAEGL